MFKIDKTNALLAAMCCVTGIAPVCNTVLAADDDSFLEEIIVTAQRREETAQKTPIVMNVLSGAELVSAGATDVKRTAELIPGVHVLTGQLTGAQVAIRGIVNNNINVGSDPSLAMSVDDLYIARAQAAFASFYDIQRVEVLRGPQGTLYGRNSVSGAMNIITNDPKHEFGFNASLDLGNYNERTTEGMVNVPLGSRVAVRFAGQTKEHDGYIDHYWGNQDDKAARIKLLAELSDNASLLLSASYFNQRSVGNVSPVYPFVNPSDPWSPDDTTVRGQSNTNNSVYNYSAKFNWDTAVGNLTYIRGMTRFVEDVVQPPAGINLSRWGTSKQDTDELRLASHSVADAAGRLAWILGIFSYREYQDQFRRVEGDPVLPPLTSPQHLLQFAGYPYVFAGSIAGFGQATYAITDHWRATLGVRGTRDTKSATGFNNFTYGPTSVNSTTAFDQSENNISYKAELETDLTPTSLLYASVTTGFHGGGWQDAPAPYDHYGAEKITSYEIGSKNELFERRLRLNIGAYYYDYKNFLVGAQNSSPGAQTCACFVNAPKARAEGVELETQLALSASDRLTMNLAYEDASYVDFRIYQPWSSTIGGGTAIPGGSDFSGTPFPFVSKWSGTGRYQHTFPLSNGGAVNAGVSAQFRTGYPGALGNNPQLYQGGYTKTDIDVGYDAPRHWSVDAYIRNLSEKTAASSAGARGPGPISATNPVVLGIGDPRTYGVRLSVRY